MDGKDGLATLNEHLIVSGAAAMRDQAGTDEREVWNVPVLGKLGYTLQQSIDADAPAHRFVRGGQQIDVMIADHLAPAKLPRIGGRRPF